MLRKFFGSPFALLMAVAIISAITYLNQNGYADVETSQVIFTSIDLDAPIVLQE
jgi:hypothetical protein